MTDAEVDTIVVAATTAARMHFQEWWTRHRAALEPVALRQPRHRVGDAGARRRAMRSRAADVVLIAPSNPVVSIGPILAVPGIREALAATSAPVVGVSPIIGGRVVRGMADVCLAAIGVRDLGCCRRRSTTARAAAGGLLDAWLLAEEDADSAAAVAGLGIRAVVAPLWMKDEVHSAAIAEAALAAAED